LRGVWRRDYVSEKNQTQTENVGEIPRVLVQTYIQTTYKKSKKNLWLILLENPCSIKAKRHPTTICSTQV